MTPLFSLPGIPEPFNSPRQALPATYWQTGHIDAIVTTTTQKKSLSGEIIYPLIDPRYTIDIDTLKDWQRAELMIIQEKYASFCLTIKTPFPASRLVVFDFDGVMTDNRVWVDQDGQEMVAANRSDSLGIAMRRAGVEVCSVERDKPRGNGTLSKAGVDLFPG